MANYNISGQFTIHSGDTVTDDIVAALNTGLPNNATLVAPTDNFVAMIQGCVEEITGSTTPTGTFAYTISGTSAGGAVGSSVTISVSYQQDLSTPPPAAITGPTPVGTSPTAGSA